MKCRRFARNTTILGVKKDGHIVVAGDGQVSMGSMTLKPNAKKVDHSFLISTLVLRALWSFALLRLVFSHWFSHITSTSQDMIVT